MMSRKTKPELEVHSLHCVNQCDPERRRKRETMKRSFSPSPASTLIQVVTQGWGPNAQPLYTWDEFGFRVEEEDGPEDTSSKLLSIPFTEVFLNYDHHHTMLREG